VSLVVNSQGGQNRSSQTKRLENRSNSSLKKKICAFTGIEDLSRSYREYKKGDYGSALKSFLRGTIKVAGISAILYASCHVLSHSNSQPKKRGKLFVNSNERGMQSVGTVLKSRSFDGEGCHVGVSAWHNYDIAAATRLKKLVIADFAQVTHDFHATSIELLKSCTTREEFIKQIAKKLLDATDGPVTENDFMHHFQLIIWENDIPVKLEDRYQQIASGELYDKIVEALKIEMNRSGSWLSSDDHFNYIRTLAVQGNIVSYHTNLADQNSFRSFSAKLNQICSTVNTLYLSNVQDWIHSSSALKQYVENIKSITEDQSLIIDAYINGDYIYQKVSRRDKWLVEQDKKTEY